jgi:hypothetical protein
MGKYKKSQSAKRKLTGSAEKQEKTTRRRFLPSSSLPDLSKNISSDTLDLSSMDGNCELNASSNRSQTVPSTSVDDAVTTDTTTADAVTTDAVPIAERIRVRIDPPHPLVCRKRRLNGAVLRMRPEKLRSRVIAGVTQ